MDERYQVSTQRQNNIPKALGPALELHHPQIMDPQKHSSILKNKKALPELLIPLNEIRSDFTRSKHCHHFCTCNREDCKAPPFASFPSTIPQSARGRTEYISDLARRLQFNGVTVDEIDNRKAEIRILPAKRILVDELAKKQYEQSQHENISYINAPEAAQFYRHYSTSPDSELQSLEQVNFDKEDFFEPNIIESETTEFLLECSTAKHHTRIEFCAGLNIDFKAGGRRFRQANLDKLQDSYDRQIGYKHLSPSEVQASYNLQARFLYLTELEDRKSNNIQPDLEDFPANYIQQ
ncbi:hypothetical protein OCU04_010270 [Sclerotinia nivalis]|uniref:Uncharacterized protein n=1 Tax=Sclerotinia nivalis TaxID=352851 RepID=A0A9X0AE76_9HELO|nr:hypothetical protein OCU04_010270 [Sclerotinia nivalis]